MKDKSKLKPLSLAVGAAFATSMAISPMASAVESPFSMNQLESGYKVADNHMGKEGNCGGKKAKEASCGGNKAKEGNCGGDKKAKEGNCGGDKKDMKKGKEGKCGEAKCGGNK